MEALTASRSASSTNGDRNTGALIDSCSTSSSTEAITTCCPT